MFNVTRVRHSYVYRGAVMFQRKPTVRNITYIGWIFKRCDKLRITEAPDLMTSLRPGIYNGLSQSSVKRNFAK